MRFRLRTLIIATAVGPPLLAGAWFIRNDVLAFLLCLAALLAAMFSTLPSTDNRP